MDQLSKIYNKEPRNQKGWKRIKENVNSSWFLLSSQTIDFPPLLPLRIFKFSTMNYFLNHLESLLQKLREGKDYH